MPFLPEVGVIALVPDQWSDQWQPRHHVLTRLARYFHVVWVNPTQDWRKVIQNRTARRRMNAANSSTGPGPLVVNQIAQWLPRFYRPKFLADFSFQFPLKVAAHALSRRNVRTRILYVWRPEFAQALRSIRSDLTCYHIDDEYSFSTMDRPLDETETTLLQRVDQVFIHSPALLEKKGCINKHTAFVPNGVDYWAHARHVPEPRDLLHVPHPRIGYTGWMKKQLDWALVRDLARKNHQWSFVFVGDISPHPEISDTVQELSRLPNIHFLGSKTTLELARYPQHFDVCIMPYQLNDYTRYIYPMKLHEYLAGGRPIVGSRIRSLEAFKDVVYLATTQDSWSDCLREALSSGANTQERQAARQSVALEHDWENLVARIATTLAKRLGENYSQRLETFLQEPVLSVNSGSRAAARG
jgi:glycosyltransferase involved in cell wall biosynthesis